MPNPYVILQGESTIVLCVECDNEYSLPVRAEQVLRWQRGVGTFQMRMPGQQEWKSYLEWSGGKHQ
jgi:hypothetical protein